MSVDVIVSPRPYMDAVAVYLIQRAGARSFAITPTPGGPGRWTKTELEERQELPDELAIVFPRDVWEALAAAAAEALPPSSAVDRHLSDAMGTRDRLLSMLEARGIR